MQRLLNVFLAAMMFSCHSALCVAQDANADDLQQQVEVLELKLQLAEKAAELLEQEVETLRVENAKLKNETTSSLASTRDAFAPGVVWAGEAVNDGKRKFRWAISVSERHGRSFEGAIAIINEDGKKIESPVTGKAPEYGDGLVVVESPTIGRAKLFMRGTLRNGKVALAFSGTTGLGDKFFGSAVLRPKN